LLQQQFVIPFIKSQF